MRAGKEAARGRITRGRPDWFGIESAIVHYVEQIRVLPTLVADDAGMVAGFLSIRNHNPHASEIYVMAVRSDRRGRGIGRALVEAAESSVRQRGVRLLQVETLAPSKPSESYAQTRVFYERLGFIALEENSLRGEETPCQIRVKPL